MVDLKDFSHTRRSEEVGGLRYEMNVVSRGTCKVSKYFKLRYEMRVMSRSIVNYNADSSSNLPGIPVL